MSRLRMLLAATTLFACSAAGLAVQAQGTLTSPRVPPDPTPAQIEQNLPDLGNPLNKPITGASQDPLAVGTRAASLAGGTSGRPARRREER